jgi:hypothetical protein
VSPYDEGLSALREHVEDLAAWLAIWQGRAEPDAHARRCASDAIGAIDGALRELYQIRERLIGEIRAADDATAAVLTSCCADAPFGPPRPSLPAGVMFRIVTIRK